MDNLIIMIIIIIVVGRDGLVSAEQNTRNHQSDGLAGLAEKCLIILNNMYANVLSNARKITFNNIIVLVSVKYIDRSQQRRHHYSN